MEALPVVVNNPPPSGGKTSASAGKTGASSAVSGGSAAGSAVTGTPPAGADGPVGEAFGEVLAKQVGEQLIGIKAIVNNGLDVAADKAAPGLAVGKPHSVQAVDATSVVADLSAIIAQLLNKQGREAEPAVLPHSGQALKADLTAAGRVALAVSGAVFRRSESESAVDAQLGGKLKVLPGEGARFDSVLEAAGIAVPGKKESAAPAGNAPDVGKELGMVTPNAGSLANSSAPVVTQTERAMVAPQVGSPDWGQAVGQRVVWLVGQQQHTAELQLNPPHLGPLEVRLTLGSDQVNATFISHHPAVREAIEAALPKLRDMLADSGIMLGNVSVGAESFMQQQQQSSQFSGRGNGGFAQGDAWDFEVEPVTTRHVSMVPGGRDGMVDTFV